MFSTIFRLEGEIIFVISWVTKPFEKGSTLKEKKLLRGMGANSFLQELTPIVKSGKTENDEVMKVYFNTVVTWFDHQF